MGNSSSENQPLGPLGHLVILHSVFLFSHRERALEAGSSQLHVLANGLSVLEGQTLENHRAFWKSMLLISRMPSCSS